MKKFLFVLAAGLTFASCSNNTEAENTEAVVANYTLDVDNSKLEWTGGKKIADYAHNGEVYFTAGTVETVDGVIESGSFTVDMNSIKVTDATPDDKKPALEGHLKNEDFFNTTSFPAAEVTIGAYKDGKVPTTVKLLGSNYTQDVPVKATVTEDKVVLTGDFNFNFEGIKAGGFSVMEDGEQIKPEISFKLHVELKK